MSQFGKEQEKWQESKKFLFKLERAVTPEGLKYYIDRSSANDGDYYCRFMSDFDYEGSEVEENKLPLEFFGCTQETNLKDVPLIAREFWSLVGGGEIYIREIQSFQRIFEQFLAEYNLRARLSEEIGTVIEEVLCIIEKTKYRLVNN